MAERAIRVRAIFALYPPLRIDSEEHVRLYRDFIADLQNPRRLRVRGSYHHDGEGLLVRTIRCTRPLEKRLFAGQHFAVKCHDIIEFSGAFKFPGTSKFFFTDHLGKRVPETENNLRETWKSFLPDRLDLTIQTYLCAAILAYPGAVRPVGNVWFVGGEQHRFSRYYVSSIPDAVEYMRENRFSPKAITFSDVRKWISSQGGVFEGYSNNGGARALNYFTRLFAPKFREDELSDTVWALAGIEALLVESGRSSVGQLKEKLGAIFASSDNVVWLLEMVETLYNYRSRMVHGNRQIRSSFRTDDAEVDKRFYEEYHSELFAVGILLLLLQHLISSKCSAFRFKTTLDKLIT